MFFLAHKSLIRTRGIQSLAGPWSAQVDIAPEDTNTYYSQNAYDMLLGTNGIYMGDRWDVSALGSSTYIWFPLSWTSGLPVIVEADVWSVDLAAGLDETLNAQDPENNY